MKQYPGVVVRDGKRGRTFSIRYFDATGTRQFETLGTEAEGWTPKKAADERKRREVAVMDKGFKAPDRKTRFAEYAETWHENYRGKKGALKRSTRAGYKTVIDVHLTPEFGTLTLAEISKQRIEQYVTRALRKGTHARVISANLRVLSLILDAAVDAEIIAVNPTTRVVRPAVEKSKQRILTPEETRAAEQMFAAMILAEPAGTRRENLIASRVAFALFMGTGIRKGELLGLRWRHVDLDAGRITIEETYVMAQQDTPKSESGKRTIDIGPRLITTLKEHRLWSAYSGDDDRVLANPRTGHIFPALDYSAILKEVLAAIGVHDPIRPCHGLRHTSLSQSAATGVDAFALRERAGHSNLATTMLYVHAAKDHSDAAAALEERLYGAVSS
jgi:integrase